MTGETPAQSEGGSYRVKVIYEVKEATMKDGRRMLARFRAESVRLVRSPNGSVLGTMSLRECLEAVEEDSSELFSDPTYDYKLKALDPLETSDQPGQSSCSGLEVSKGWFSVGLNNTKLTVRGRVVEDIHGGDEWNLIDDDDSDDYSVREVLEIHLRLLQQVPPANRKKRQESTTTRPSMQETSTFTRETSVFSMSNTPRPDSGNTPLPEAIDPSHSGELQGWNRAAVGSDAAVGRDVIATLSIEPTKSPTLPHHVLQELQDGAGTSQPLSSNAMTSLNELLRSGAGAVPIGMTAATAARGKGKEVGDVAPIEAPADSSRLDGIPAGQSKRPLTTPIPIFPSSQPPSSRPTLPSTTVNDVPGSWTGTLPVSLTDRPTQLGKTTAVQNPRNVNAADGPPLSSSGSAPRLRLPGDISLTSAAAAVPTLPHTNIPPFTSQKVALSSKADATVASSAPHEPRKLRKKNAKEDLDLTTLSADTPKAATGEDLADSQPRGRGRPKGSTTRPRAVRERLKLENKLKKQRRLEEAERKREETARKRAEKEDKKREREGRKGKGKASTARAKTQPQRSEDGEDADGEQSPGTQAHQFGDEATPAQEAYSPIAKTTPRKRNPSGVVRFMQSSPVLSTAPSEALRRGQFGFNTGSKSSPGISMFGADRFMSSPNTAFEKLMSECDNDTFGLNGPTPDLESFMTPGGSLRRSPRKNPSGTIGASNPYASSLLGTPSLNRTGFSHEVGSSGGHGGSSSGSAFGTPMTRSRSRAELGNGTEHAALLSSRDSQRRGAKRKHSSSITSPASPVPAKQTVAPPCISPKRTRISPRRAATQEQSAAATKPSTNKSTASASLEDMTLWGWGAAGPQDEDDADEVVNELDASPSSHLQATRGRMSSSSQGTLTKGPSGASRAAASTPRDRPDREVSPSPASRKAAANGSVSQSSTSAKAGRSPTRAAALAPSLPTRIARRPLPATVEDASSTCGSSPDDGYDGGSIEDDGDVDTDNMDLAALLAGYDDPYGILASGAAALPQHLLNGTLAGSIEVHGALDFSSHMTEFTLQGAEGVAAHVESRGHAGGQSTAHHVYDQGPQAQHSGDAAVEIELAGTRAAAAREAQGQHDAMALLDWMQGSGTGPAPDLVFLGVGQRPALGPHSTLPNPALAAQLHPPVEEVKEEYGTTPTAQEHQGAEVWDEHVMNAMIDSLGTQGTSVQLTAGQGHEGAVARGL